ncbi:MAG TPA: prolyl oligopeptidase family serine peptidase [Bacteroidales bacterium]|nr:prolyl oligopeptidase family serine peptidase [Bacteroidales bacterium]
MLSTLFSCLFAQQEYYTSAGFARDGGLLPFRIMYPEGFTVEAKYPLIIFLHGAGERGNDNQKQLVHGANFFAQYNRRQYPAVVVFPQCPENQYWASVDFTWHDDGSRTFGFRPEKEPTPPLSLVIQLIDSLLTTPWIDHSRIYIGGLSMGGMGTFEMIYRLPDVFAAAFPVCGGGKPETAPFFASKVPVWVFHGDADPVVPISLSTAMVDALRNAGADPLFTIYPGVGHNAWDYTFQEPDLIPWLFQQKKSSQKRQ